MSMPVSMLAEADVAGDVAVAVEEAHSDDLAREVYCILGMPIDAIDMPALVRKIEAAAAKAAPFVLSTPNINFLVASQVDPEFRESLLLSDVCATDGVPIVWIAQLMGIPIRRRTAGSDLLEALKARTGRPLRLFLFGSTDEVAAAAAQRLNENQTGVRCVGWSCPGFGPMDELSQDCFIEKINAAGADFLMASLGAKKGQLWLQSNHHRLRTPVRAHLGATVNFQAGTVKRAPPAVRMLALEWLWRIKEEPHLWRRYWDDGRALARLMLTRILPLAIESWWQRRQQVGGDLMITPVQGHDSVTLRLYGTAAADQVAHAATYFRSAVRSRKNVVIDLSAAHAVDMRFMGLLLMLRKQLKQQGRDLSIIGVLPKVERTFRLNGADFLLNASKSVKSDRV